MPSLSHSTHSSTLAQQFAQLAVAQHLYDRSDGYRRAKERFIVYEFEEYFGEDTKLGNWQKLCQDLGIGGGGGEKEELRSITKCKKALARIWVNIWDLLSAVRQGKQVRLWRSQAALALYTRKNKLYYPKEKAKEHGPVKALLARIR